MPYAPPSRLHADDTNDFLTEAAEIVDISGITHLLDPEAATTTEGAVAGDAGKATGGRKAYLPRYTARTILIVMLELGWRGDAFSWTRMAHALWFRYSAEEMNTIGLAGWRTRDRRDVMRPAAEHKNSKKVVAATSASTWKAEVSRLQAAAEAIFTQIDDTALPANKRQSATALMTAVAAPDVVARRNLQRTVMNRLLWAALVRANANHYPDVEQENLHGGLLRHHKGDLAIDEHNITVGLSQNNRRGTRPVKQMAAIAGHVRREGSGQAIGLTAAVAVSRPDSYRVPTITLGFDLHAPASEAAQGARNAIDQVERNDMRPALASTAHQYVVTDKAYPRYIQFNEWLLDKKYTLLSKYQEATEQRVPAPFRDLSPAPRPGETETTGPYQFNGVFLCPGIGAATLHTHAGFDIPKEDTWTPQWIRSHDVTEWQLTGAIMPTNGRPKRVKAAGRGRPRLNSAPIQDTWSVHVTCPAVALNPKVRCPLIQESLDLDEHQYPTLRHAPAPDGPQPRCCTEGFMKWTLGPQHIKNWQTKMAGTWEHQDIYSPARTRNEWFFSRLMDPDGGNLVLGKIEWHRNAFVALAITTTLIATNLRIIARWEEERERNNGAAPRETGRRRRAYREHLAAS